MRPVSPASSVFLTKKPNSTIAGRFLTLGLPKNISDKTGESLCDKELNVLCGLWFGLAGVKLGAKNPRLTQAESFQLTAPPKLRDPLPQNCSILDSCGL